MIANDNVFSCFMQFISNAEGGLSNQAWDNGGLTKYGITKKSYPDLDIENLTWPQAEAIYKLDYWHAASCHLLPGPLAIIVCDNAIMSGVYRAIVNLQRSLGVTPDGVVGPTTINAATHAYVVDKCRDVSKRLIARRLQAMILHDDWRFAGNGWISRMLELFNLSMNV